MVLVPSKGSRQKMVVLQFSVDISRYINHSLVKRKESSPLHYVWTKIMIIVGCKGSQVWGEKILKMARYGDVEWSSERKREREPESDSITRQTLIDRELIPLKFHEKKQKKPIPCEGKRHFGGFWPSVGYNDYLIVGELWRRDEASPWILCSNIDYPQSGNRKYANPTNKFPRPQNAGGMDSDPLPDRPTFSWRPILFTLGCFVVFVTLGLRTK